MRIIRNGCKCDNTLPKHLNDKLNTVCCENCLEVISYEPIRTPKNINPELQVVAPEKKPKKRKQLKLDV